jgi:hypothetical protein
MLPAQLQRQHTDREVGGDDAERRVEIRDTTRKSIVRPARAATR